MLLGQKCQLCFIQIYKYSTKSQMAVPLSVYNTLIGLFRNLNWKLIILLIYAVTPLNCRNKYILIVKNLKISRSKSKSPTQG